MAGSKLTGNQLKKRLHEVATDTTGFEQTANELLELGDQHLETDDAYVSLIDKDTNHCEIVVSTFEAGGEFPADTNPELDKTYCRRTVEATEPVALHDAPAQGWEDDPAYETHEFDTYLGTKFTLSDGLYITVCFVSEDARENSFSDTETLFVELISQLLAREFESEKYEAEITRHSNLVNIINRVLRHNLRNDMSVIRGHTKLMAEQLHDEPHENVAINKIDELIDLSEKARDLEEIIGQNTAQEQTDIGSLVHAVVSEVKADFPDTSVSLNTPQRVTATVSPAFERALRELIENAAKHGGETPSVEVSVEIESNTVDIIVEDDGPGLSEQEQEVLTTGIETPLIHGSGLGLWLTHWVITDHDGTIESTVTDNGTRMRVSVPKATTPTTNSTREVTDLEQARDQYQAAFEEAFDAVYILNNDARIIKANPAAADIYGLTQAEIRGRSVMEFLPDEYDVDEVQNHIQQSNTGREIVTITRSDGTERKVEFSSTANIVPGQHLIIARDVTDRVEREQRLTEAQTVFENTQDAMFLIDVSDGHTFTIQRVNEVYESMTGLSNEEIQDKTPREAVGEKIGSSIEAQYQQCVERREMIEYPEEIPVDGEMRYWRTKLTPIIDDGDVVKLVGAMRNVTEQKARQEKLQKEYERFDQLLNTSPIGIVVLDQNGVFVRANEQAEAVLGLDKSEITNRRYDTPDWELVAADGSPMPSTELPFQQVMQTGEPVYEYVHGIETTDGSRRWLSVNAAPLTNDDGDIERVIAALTDITEQHQVQSVTD